MIAKAGETRGSRTALSLKYFIYQVSQYCSSKETIVVGVQSKKLLVYQSNITKIEIKGALDNFQHHSSIFFPNKLIKQLYLKSIHPLHDIWLINQWCTYLYVEVSNRIISLKSVHLLRGRHHYYHTFFHKRGLLLKDFQSVSLIM